MKSRSPLFALWAAISFNGCAGTGLNGTPMRTGTSDAVVTIANRGPLAMHVYARVGATTIPLGLLPGFTSRPFAIPAWSLAAFSEIQLEARERGGGRSSVRSESFSLGSARSVWWTLDSERANRVVVK